VARSHSIFSVQESLDASTPLVLHCTLNNTKTPSSVNGLDGLAETLYQLPMSSSSLMRGHTPEIEIYLRAIL
jgi:hypothetical protein